MPKNARVTDKVESITPCNPGHSCCKHDKWTGTITKGARRCTINNLPAAREGDFGMTECPHPSRFTIDRPIGCTVELEGKLAAREGDLVTCDRCQAKGRIVTSSPNVSTDGGGAWDSPFRSGD